MFLLIILELRRRRRSPPPVLCSPPRSTRRQCWFVSPLRPLATSAFLLSYDLSSGSQFLHSTVLTTSGTNYSLLLAVLRFMFFPQERHRFKYSWLNSMCDGYDDHEFFFFLLSLSMQKVKKKLKLNWFISRLQTTQEKQVRHHLKMTTLRTLWEFECAS